MADQAPAPGVGTSQPGEERATLEAASPPRSSRLWERLRRHKVAQWTLAYAAAAYTTLHAVEMVSGALGWPHAIVRIVTLVLLLGVPVAVTLAWFHGHRAQQRVGPVEVAILTLLLLLAGAILWGLGRPAPEAEQSTAARLGAGSGGLPEASFGPAAASIAVLPFDNRSRLEDDAYFVEGIHDDILTQLSKLSSVRVTSHVSVEQFRDTRLSARAIAERLGVRNIVEGGVQRAGDRVRVTVQLIDAQSDSHLWAESYDRELTVANVFASLPSRPRSPRPLRPPSRSGCPHGTNLRCRGCRPTAWRRTSHTCSGNTAWVPGRVPGSQPRPNISSRPSSWTPTSLRRTWASPRR